MSRREEREKQKIDDESHYEIAKKNPNTSDEGGRYQHGDNQILNQN